MHRIKSTRQDNVLLKRGAKGGFEAKLADLGLHVVRVDR